MLVRAEARLTDWLSEHYPALASLHTPARAKEERQRIMSETPERAFDLTWVRTESLRRLAAMAQCPPSVADEAFRVFHGARNEVEPYPDVYSGLARLAERFPLYALSNGNADVHQTVLGPYFKLGVSAIQAGAAKPDSKIFDYLISRVGVRPSQIIHIGDDPVTDVQGGRLAGCRTVWVNRHQRAWPEDLPRADAEVNDLHGLSTLLIGA